tara:strand:- start:1246 stop:1560 length:315 start_codon:yes stop_codon:yes gene_type:complete
MEKLKKLGLILGSGVIASIIFAVILLGLSFLADFLKNNVGFEPWLFVDSFLKSIAIVFVASWIWIAGKFLNKVKLAKYGRYLLILWVLVSVVPYILSFSVTPNG